MDSTSSNLPRVLVYLSMLCPLLLACGDGADSAAEPLDSRTNGSNLPESERPDPESADELPTTRLVVDCDVDLGLKPEDGIIVDFMDREQSWQAAWDGDALVLTRRFSCGDECAEEELLRIEDALSACPQQVVSRVTVRDHGSPRDQLQIHESDQGRLTLQDWEVSKEGRILVSGVVEAGARFVVYLDTEAD